MLRVSLNGHLLAESRDTIVDEEGNHYFPPTSVRKSTLSRSDTTSVSVRKGTAFYYNAMVDNRLTKDVAWYYPTAISDRTKSIEGYIAFDKVSQQFICVIFTV
ncbi:DUF427-domain-containing protein [Agrocybe pediades]|nr:DUF427-domain-containing protein [Agrocybe pediades]